MAKDKGKKQPAEKKRKKPKKAATASIGAKAKTSATRATVDKAVRSAKTKARELSANPAVAEIVAASLVAAAAAIKNPKKARDLAASVGDELEAASKQGIDKGGAFWQLALDVARRSIDALGSDKRGGAKPKPGRKKKPKK